MSPVKRRKAQTPLVQPTVVRPWLLETAWGRILGGSGIVLFLVGLDLLIAGNSASFFLILVAMEVLIAWSTLWAIAWLRSVRERETS